MITRRMTIGAACYLFDSGDVRRMCGSVRPRELSAMPRNTVTNLTFSVSPGNGWAKATQDPVEGSLCTPGAIKVTYNPVFANPHSRLGTEPAAGTIRR